jgi:hypothetical protein
MQFLFSQRSQPYAKGPAPFSGSLLTLGLLSILFGLAIVSAPELLAYIVAGFFLFAGVWMLGLWWKIRRL